MADNMSDQSRRKLLKSIAAGSGAIVAGKSLPESWTRPVVDSVMLPAHAQTSEVISNGPFAGNATTDGVSLESDSIFAKASDSLISQAQAGLQRKLLGEPYVCVTPNSSLDAATVRLQTGNEVLTFTDVPLEGNKCDPEHEFVLCPVLPQEIVDAGGLLEDLGLINDAHADVSYCCYLDSITGKGAGRIESSSFPTVEFDVGPNVCSPPDPCERLVLELPE